MKHNKLIIAGVTLLSLASIASLSSCNDGANSPYTIVFQHTFGQDVRNSVERYCKKFVKIVKEQDNIDLDIKLDYAGNYSDCVKKTTNKISTGDLPTITVAYPDHVAIYKALEKKDKRIVVPLDSYIDDPVIGLTKEAAYNPNLNGVDDIVESFLDEGRQYTEEGTYSFPFQKSTEIMLFDKARVEQILIDMGKDINTSVEDYLNGITWNDFIDILRYEKQHISKYYPTNSENVYPFAYDSDANLFISQSYQRDIPFISMENGKGKCDFNNDQAKAMVNEFKNLYEEGLLLTKGTNNGDYTSDLFKELGCTFVASSTGGTSYNDASSSLNGGIGVCKIPTYSKEREKYVSQGVTLCMLNNTKIGEENNKTRLKYAWRLIKYLTSTEVCADISLDSAGYIPCRYSSYTCENYADYLSTQDTDFMPKVASKVINEINGNYFNYPVFKGTEKVREQVGWVVTNVLLGSQSMNEAFETAYKNSVNDMQ